MKKIRRVCLCMALIAALIFGGCGESQIGPKEKKQKKITLHWMICGERSKSSDSVIAQFNKELQKFYPDTTVEFEIVPSSSYKKAWDMKMAANEKLDLIWIGNDIFNYTEEVKKGGFMALDYLINTNGKDLQKEIPKELWEKQTRDGKIYSIPILGPLYRKDYAIVTSKSSMEQYGDLETIKKINQEKQYSDQECYEVIERYLEQLKQAQKLGAGVSCDTFSQMAQKGYEGIYGPFSPFVIRIFDKQPKVYNKYELDSYREYFKTMHEWYEKGYIRQDIEEILAPEKDLGVKNGNVLFLDEYGEHGTVEEPIMTEYEAVRIPLQDYKYISYESCRNAVAVPRTTENPKRAVEVVNLLNMEQGENLLRLLCNGFEGRHYIKRKGNQIDKVTGKTGSPIYSISSYTIGNAFHNYEKTEGEFQQLQTYNENAVVSPLTGFELDTRMIVIEMEKIELVVEEYLDILEQGTSENWEETYQEMLYKMKEAGADKVIEEMQNQLDAFLKSKDTNPNERYEN